MHRGPIQDLSESGNIHLYDWRHKIPLLVSQPYALPVDSASLRLDRRVPERFRTGDFDYSGEGRFMALSLGGVRYSFVVPATLGCKGTYLELCSHISWLRAGRKKGDRTMGFGDGNPTFVASGPLFDFKKIIPLGNNGPSIPHHIWVSVLCEYDTGRLGCWSFIISNINTPPLLEGSLTSTTHLEEQIGMKLWDEYSDTSLEKSKSKTASIWW